MEVDGNNTSSSIPAPVVSDSQSVGISQGLNKLKRSSSAPMINHLLPMSSTSTSVATMRDVLNEGMGAQPRIRRSSASYCSLSPLSPGSARRSSSRMRVCQLREEEGMDTADWEAAHERTVQCSIQMAQSLSQSCEDLTLDDDSRPKSAGSLAGLRRDFTDPLQLTILPQGSPLGGSASSPNRLLGRPPCSPSLYLMSSSPSPTKKVYTARRSLSPIALRPSILGVKRKSEMDENFLTPSKRASHNAMDRCSGGLLIAQPHSIANLESSSSSPAGGGGSLGSVGTPESLCSSGSPGPPVHPYSPASLGETPAPTPDPPGHLLKPLSPPLSNEQLTSFSGVFSGPNSKSSSESSDTGCDAVMAEITSSSPSPSADKSYQAMDLSESIV